MTDTGVLADVAPASVDYGLGNFAFYNDPPPTDQSGRWSSPPPVGTSTAPSGGRR